MSVRIADAPAPSETRSLGVARPSATRPAIRAMSVMGASWSPSAPARVRSSLRAWTVSRRALMDLGSVSGALSQ